VNAFVRLSSALVVLALASSLAGCAAAQRDAWNPPREIRETHVVGELPLRSSEQSPTTLRSHERSQAAHDRPTFLMGK
jgi:hypothetical protein